MFFHRLPIFLSTAMAKAAYKFTTKRLKQIEAALYEYVDATEIPILSEFAYRNKIRRQRLYEYDELEDAREYCLAKKEAALERHMLEGTAPIAGCIFSLKQLGWTDRQAIDITDPLTKFAEAFGKIGTDRKP